MAGERYVEIITRDEMDKIVRETPTVYDTDRLEREYEFDDGAVVKYEWRDSSLGSFNHQFTLIRPPKPNPRKLAPCVILTIDY